MAWKWIISLNLHLQIGRPCRYSGKKAAEWVYFGTRLGAVRCAVFSSRNTTTLAFVRVVSPTGSQVSIGYTAPSMEPRTGLVTELLRALGNGDREVLPRLVELIYSELYGIAKARMRAEHSGHSLSPTALVNEAYVRLAGSADLNFQNRGHFLAVAGRAMRRILVDHARARCTARRGGENAQSPITDLQISLPQPDEQVIALDEALERLGALSPRQCQVVELKYFVGLSEEEVAGALGVARRTVDRDWKLARAWLHSQVAR